MIIIKIHDKNWFNKNCKVVYAKEGVSFIEPKYSPWKHVTTFSWSLIDIDMSLLVGQILKVNIDDGNTAGNITDARYFAGGYWVPNWAIEWVKEEPNNKEV